MSFLKNMRVVRIPPFRAVTSGEQNFDDLFAPGGFMDWCEEHLYLIRDLIYEPSDFLWHTGDPATYGKGTNVWIWALNDGVSEAEVAPYEILDFPGGIYLVATANENNPEDMNETISSMMDWINASPVFEYGDFPASGMCNMPAGDESIDQALGIAQQQIFLPLKYRLPKS